MDTFEDTLDWAAYQDEEGIKLDRETREQILIDHGHEDERTQDGQYDDRNETIGMGWVELYEWLGY